MSGGRRAPPVRAFKCVERGRDGEFSAAKKVHASLSHSSRPIAMHRVQVEQLDGTTAVLDVPDGETILEVKENGEKRETKADETRQNHPTPT